MGGSVWKTQDLRMEVSPRVFALAKRFGPGLGGIQLLRGEGDETAELFLLGYTFDRGPGFGSRGKAPVGTGTGVGPVTPQGVGPRSHWNVTGCAGARDTRWSHAGATRLYPVGALRGPVPRPIALVVGRHRPMTVTVTGTSRLVVKSGLVRLHRWPIKHHMGTRAGRRDAAGTELQRGHTGMGGWILSGNWPHGRYGAKPGPVAAAAHGT
jgi:hypothetical protein